MDERTVRVLEFPKIRARLERCAGCELGKELARAIEPETDMRVVEERILETSEARRWLDKGKSIPLGGIKDVREPVTQASKGLSLFPSELVEIRHTLEGSRRLRKAISDSSAEFPRLMNLAHGIHHHHSVETAIAKAISDAGDVLDDASSELRRIRHVIKSLNNKVRDTLDSIIRSPQWSKVLQDAVVSIRAGRFVIPVRSEFRTQVGGIVHDQSASGATVFMEPMAVVEINNELRRAMADEEAEIARILGELSAMVGSEASSILETLNSLGRIDFAFAKGRLSSEMEATAPVVNKEGVIDLKGARHPLLTGPTVPIDPCLGLGFTTLVITGPNTGGKTVALKTIGLLTLMAEAGLHIPADEGSKICVFDQVYADIGDEQSIEQSLSTFSSHLTHIIDITKRLNGLCLVLLDELGAGTDPEEGAALAISILEYLHAAGARTVATTHYRELKVFAHTAQGMRNASVEFDVETLKPTYRLSIGIPGSSNAFAIARRLGLPEDILSRAMSLVSSSDSKVEEMITSLRDEYGRAERAARDAERLRTRYLDLKDKYEKELRAIRADKAEQIRKAKLEAENTVRQAKREVERIISSLTAQGSITSAAIKSARQNVDALQRSLDQVTEEGLPAAVPEPDEPDYPGPIVPGDQVEIIGLGQRGTVLGQVGQDDFIVSIGSVKVNVKANSLRKRNPEPDTKAGPAGPSLETLGRERAETISPELDLRGMTVEEGLNAVDKYLDDALLSGIGRVRIIHGKGTGALRQAVRSMLTKDRRASSFRTGAPGEGGDGVAIVEIG